MLHRFRDPELGLHGHDVKHVRRCLAYVRKKRFEVLRVDEILRRLFDGRSVGQAVAFTIDDGYREHALVAGPVFAEFDCPVTTFVASGFLDGRLWYWWDRIEHVFDTTARWQLTVSMGREQVPYGWTDPEGRYRAKADFTERCKWVADAEKHAAIASLASAAGVEVSKTPPARYAPMTWDELRTAEDGGMSFGAHTVTHPILVQTSDKQSRREIADSWSRLREESRDPVPVFCYPNGQPTDFGAREIQNLREVGLAGAVIGVPGHVAKSTVEADGAFRIPRFPLSDRFDDFMQVVTGMEQLKRLARGMA